MNKSIYCNLFFVLFIFLAVEASAQQNLFVPRNVEKAFVNGTRSYDGNPGKNYWQNSSVYNIKADVDPFKKLLTGTQTIMYRNDSPDTLKSLVIRLYQNINKKSSARDFNLWRDFTNDGMTVTRLVINHNQYTLEDRKAVSVSGTNMIIKLDQPISPSSENVIEVDWNFELPSGPSIRFGNYDSTSYFIAYWYPQIAVYDDLDGWDMNEYTGTTEFYNDFADFTIEFTLPNNFFLWSTGILQNPEKIYSQKILDRYRQSFYTDEIINVVTKEEAGKYNLLKNDEAKNKWIIKAESVPDFAFGFSDHYLWDASSVVVDSLSGKRVQVNSVYKETSKDFYDVCGIMKKVLIHFSFSLPGVAYPYPASTIFNGAGGMEFPMIVNNGSEDSYNRAASLAAHEIAHTYFPFYMGINERKYAWMDEGYAVLFTNDFQENVLVGYTERPGVVKSYERAAGNESELPLITPSTQMRNSTYRIAAYNKPATAYNLLSHLLGKELYLKTLKEFIRRWNGKHPSPYDFFNTFNNVTGSDLSWFWKPWFFEHGYPDLSIKDFKVLGNEVFVNVKKTGNYPVPVVLTCYNSIGEKYTNRVEASVWKDGNVEFEIKVMISGYPQRIEIGDDTIPDVNRTDNILFPGKE
ncbi:MAG: M1 family metallopeptidase [Ignavibacteriales bacterium]|nr:MAG: M1 family metallopeptidase [Ignavibacteriales bacterium]